MPEVEIQSTIPDVDRIDCAIADVEGAYECAIHAERDHPESIERVTVDEYTFNDVESRFVSGGKRSGGNGFAIELDNELQCWVLRDSFTKKLRCEDRDRPPEW